MGIGRVHGLSNRCCPCLGLGLDSLNLQIGCELGSAIGGLAPLPHLYYRYQLGGRWTGQSGCPAGAFVFVLEAASLSNPIASPSSQPERSESERYRTFIEQIVTGTLKGRISSKEQVYQQLSAALEDGLGELFERALVERQGAVQAQLDAGSEFQQAKALRQSRALKVLAEAWQRWQQENQAKTASVAAIAQLQAAAPEDRLAVLFQILDPNQTYVFNRKQIALLAAELVQAEDTGLRPLGAGLEQGLRAFAAMEAHLIGWMYDAPQRAVGFESSRQQVSPWKYWAQHSRSALAQELFLGQTENRSAYGLAEAQIQVDVAGWIELAILLRGMQGGLIAWFDKQPYSLTGGRNLAAMTFLTFALLWSELSGGFRANSALPGNQAQLMARACFQVALQILRAFAQRDNFPLYGGILASFSGEGFRETVSYLDQPLRALDNTQEKARILTLLAYSQGWLGDLETSLELHQEALDLAQAAGDQRCAIANLNHLSRSHLKLQGYEQAIALGQRALIQARQTGDQLGEAQALVSTACAEVRQAQSQERPDGDRLAFTVEQLRQGLQRAEKLGDRVSQTLCSNALGLAYLLLGRNRAAQEALEQAVKLAQHSGNGELHGLGQTYLAEALYQQNEPTAALYHACLGMYLLEQRGMGEWRQAAGIVSILQGQQGEAAFDQALQEHRSELIALIGVDGFDHLPALLERYRQG